MKPAREKRWIVRVGDGTCVADVLAKMREGEEAVREGRVFVGKKRIGDSKVAVRAGDEVRVGAPARAANAISIALRDEGVVGAIKPAGMVTVPDHAGASHAFAEQVAKAAGVPAAVLRVTSRLDREVSGIVLFATDEASEARLREARARGAYVRRYVAIATHARSLPDEGTWDAPIGAGRDPRHRAAHGADAKESRTDYRVVARARDFALVAVAPITGRTHQIRVHSAHAGAPLLGDRDYGGASAVTLDDGRVVSLARIALHAARVTVPSARGGGEPLVVTAPIPPELTAVWAELGGDAEAWNTAVSCDVGRSSP